MRAADELAQIIIKDLGANPADIDPDALVALLDPQTIDDMLAPILADEERAKWNKFTDLFPDTGPLRRELYPRHLKFFKAGKTFRERCFMAANRVGKSVAGGYETTAHLTGEYPKWWPGRTFMRPVRAWVAGDTNETTRDILQRLLLGEIAYDGATKIVDGTGLIPREALGRPTWKQGVANFVDTIPIKHKSGGWSLLGFKSFDQGRRVFQGTAMELIWLDEECPMDVYGECLIRTATTRGIIMTTFTPLLGLSELVLSFLPDDLRPAD
jgi:phage terminase large subunit-like protein